MNRRLSKAFGIIFSIFVVIIVCLYFIQKQQFSKMQISDKCIIEVYYISQTEDCILVNVIDDYISSERLFLVSREGILFQCKELIEEKGLKDIVEIKVYPWKEKTFVEVACSTSKGNGEITIYELEDSNLKLLLEDKKAVDRNMDTTSNTVYENGKLNVQLRESSNQKSMPKIVLEGVEIVYGYEEEGDYSGTEMLYQRNYIEHIYEWNEKSGKYLELENKKELLQQVEDIYPIVW